MYSGKGRSYKGEMLRIIDHTSKNIFYLHVDWGSTSPTDSSNDYFSSSYGLVAFVDFFLLAKVCELNNTCKYVSRYAKIKKERGNSRKIIFLRLTINSLEWAYKSSYLPEAVFPVYFLAHICSVFESSHAAIVSSIRRSKNSFYTYMNGNLVVPSHQKQRIC